MKIKKFENKWTMGLIVFGALLLTFYLLSLIVPNFVIQIAEIESVVKFGNYIDSHLWAYYLFTFFISFITIYIYCCACCRKPRLNFKEIIFIICDILLMFLFAEIIPEYYSNIDMVFMIILPTLMCLINKVENIKYLYSIISCFSVHYIAQILSTKIRNIASLVSYPNSATFTILLIDGFIWLELLYCFFNNKKLEVKNNG